MVTLEIRDAGVPKSDPHVCAHLLYVYYADRVRFFLASSLPLIFFAELLKVRKKRLAEASENKQINKW